MNRTKKIIIYGVIIAVLVAGAVFYTNKSSFPGLNREVQANAPEAVKTMVRVQEAKTVEKTSGMTFKATLEPSSEGIVSTKLGGKVVGILFENGKSVGKDDSLILLDSQDISNQLKAAEANLPKLQANLEASQRSYDRTKVLFEQGGATQVNLENADTALKVARADMESAKINIGILKDNLDNTVVRAPIAGTVDDKGVSLGQFVSPGMVLAKVKNISSIHAVIQVEQNEVNYIKTGQKALVKLSDGDSGTYEGVVKSIGVSANPASRVVNCEVLVDNKDLALRPGAFARVEISSGQKREAVVIPVEALLGGEGDYSVFVVEDGTARKRSVSIGEISKDLAEVKSGIIKGEGIIVTNLNSLQDGDLISIAGQGE